MVEPVSANFFAKHNPYGPVTPRTTPRFKVADGPSVKTGLRFSTDVDTAGTSLLRRVDFLPLAAVAALSGQNPYTNPNGYVEDEKGYDGWTVTGTFNGEVFNLYTRWGVLRVGGRDLDVDGLVAALTARLTRN
jgi:hypothetical protein